MSIAEKLKKLPDSAGVYIMLDEFSAILYVGKAKNLKNRVKQYFQSGVKNDKTIALVNKIKDFRYIVTPNEYEALILENNLIKEHNPPYNILLKDDKTYPYIKINVKDKFPRIEITHRLKSDGAKYFGPYMLGVSSRETIDVIHSVFKVRNCKNMPKKECLNYHLNRCGAPCIKKTTEEEYKKTINDVIKFLQGNDEEIAENLHEKMINAAEREEFEAAKRYRDTINLLEKLSRKQTIPFKQKLDIDVFTFATNGTYSVVNCFIVRGGKFLGGENFPYEEIDYNNGLTSFIMQYYEKNPIICDEILINSDLEFKEELGDYLSAKCGKRILILKPNGGMRKSIVDIGETNCTEFLENQLERFKAKSRAVTGGMEQLRDCLNLQTLPKRIECFDISHISGTNKVASMTVLINGETANKYYRHFKVIAVGNDDFISMEETVARRLKNLSGNDLSFSQKPDLIVIDGGKGQLSSALKAAKTADVSDIAFISLAEKNEEIFVPEKSEPLILPRSSLALKMLIKVRDEAHRFAVTHHINMRTKKQTETRLTEIDGIGKVKAQNLLKKFKSIENLKKATIAELSSTQSITKNDIEAIQKWQTT